MIARLRQRPARAALVLLVAAIPALGVSVNVMGARPYSFDEELARDPVYRYRVVYELLPQGVEGWREWTRQPFPESRATLIGSGRVDELEWTAHTRRLRVEASADARLRLLTFDFPGWEARVDGRPAPIRADNPQRAIEVEVPAGTHMVEVEFISTPPRLWGAVLSGLGVLGLVLVAIAVARKERFRSAPV